MHRSARLQAPDLINPAAVQRALVSELSYVLSLSLRCLCWAFSSHLIVIQQGRRGFRDLDPHLSKACFTTGQTEYHIYLGCVFFFPPHVLLWYFTNICGLHDSVSFPLSGLPLDSVPLWLPLGWAHIYTNGHTCAHTCKQQQLFCGHADALAGFCLFGSVWLHSEGLRVIVEPKCDTWVLKVKDCHMDACAE